MLSVTVTVADVDIVATRVSVCADCVGVCDVETDQKNVAVRDQLILFVSLTGLVRIAETESEPETDIEDVSVKDTGNVAEFDDV